MKSAGEQHLIADHYVHFPWVTSLSYKKRKILKKPEESKRSDPQKKMSVNRGAASLSACPRHAWGAGQGGISGKRARKVEKTEKSVSVRTFRNTSNMKKGPNRSILSQFRNTEGKERP